MCVFRNSDMRGSGAVFARRSFRVDAAQVQAQQTNNYSGCQAGETFIQIGWFFQNCIQHIASWLRSSSHVQLFKSRSKKAALSFLHSTYYNTSSAEVQKIVGLCGHLIRSIRVGSRFVLAGELHVGHAPLYRPLFFRPQLQKYHYYPSETAHHPRASSLAPPCCPCRRE